MCAYMRAHVHVRVMRVRVRVRMHVVCVCTEDINRTDIEVTNRANNDY